MYQIPSILPISFPFPWDQLELGFSECGSDWLILDPSQFCCISQTQREKLICASTFESEIVYSLSRIGLCREPNSSPVSLGGHSLGVSECIFGVGLIDSRGRHSIYTVRARPILSFSWSKTEKYSPQEDITLNPGLQLIHDVCVHLKSAIATVLPTLGKTEYTPVSLNLTCLSLLIQS